MTKKYFEAVSGKGRKKAQFVVPIRKSGSLSFVSIKTGDGVAQFVSVYTGVDLTPEKVLAKMIEAGLVIESAEETLNDLRTMLERSKSSKLGHVYEAELSGQDFEFKCRGRLRAT